VFHAQAERISICSIEKANGAINKLIQEQRLHELVSVTIDEAHMLADTNRWAQPPGGGVISDVRSAAQQAGGKPQEVLQPDCVNDCELLPPLSLRCVCVCCIAACAGVRHWRCCSAS
jgi:hypothetical protein